MVDYEWTTMSYHLQNSESSANEFSKLAQFVLPNSSAEDSKFSY